jgi:hypothetical protein
MEETPLYTANRRINSHEIHAAMVHNRAALLLPCLLFALHPIDAPRKWCSASPRGKCSSDYRR